MFSVVKQVLGNAGGVRMTGGGFSGCVLALIPQELGDPVRAASGLDASIYVCHASAGAGIVS